MPDLIRPLLQDPVLLFFLRLSLQTQFLVFQYKNTALFLLVSTKSEKSINSGVHASGYNSDRESKR